MMDDSFGRMWIIKTRREVKNIVSRQTFSGDRSVTSIVSSFGLLLSIEAVIVSQVYKQNVLRCLIKRGIALASQYILVFVIIGIGASRVSTVSC
jgi:hypothetical protein